MKIGLIILGLGLIGCSDVSLETSEDVGSVQQLLCTAPPNPSGTVSCPTGSHVDSIRGNGNETIRVTCSNGSSGNITLGTGSGYTCTGQWAHTSDTIRGILMSGINDAQGQPNGGRLRIYGNGWSSDVSCTGATTYFLNGQWGYSSSVGDLEYVTGYTTTGGTPRLQFQGWSAGTWKTANVSVKNTCM